MNTRALFACRRFWHGMSLAAPLLVVLASSSAIALDDPTRPPTVRSGSTAASTNGATNPMLVSVLIAPGRRVAVIDGETFVEGETHGAITVRRIEHDGVDVAVAGRGEIKLRLKVSGFTKEERSQ